MGSISATTQCHLLSSSFARQSLHFIPFKPITHGFAVFSPKPILSRPISISAKSSSQEPTSSDHHHQHHLKSLPEAFISVLKPTAAIAAGLLLLLSFRRPNTVPVLPASSPFAAVAPQVETIPSEGESAGGKTISGDIEALQKLMEDRIREQNLPEAIRIMDRMVQLRPDDKDLLVLKAHLHVRAGDMEMAKAVFEDVLRKEPLTVEAYHGLVMIATQAEETNGSVEELDKVMERIAVAMRQCKEENRNEDLREFKLLVAQVRVMDGEYDEALGVYQELAKEEPRDFRPYLCQGIIYTLLSKKDEADKHFEKYRGLVPKGHPYAQYFEENMAVIKAFGQKPGSKRASTLGR